MTMGHDNAGCEDLAEFLATLPPSMDCHGGYDDTKLTALIRSDLALAVKRGVLPAGTKVSVRKVYYTSIHVDIVAWSGAVFTDAYVSHHMDPATRDKDFADGRPTLRDSRLVGALQNALDTIRKIANRHNYDNSRSEVDYFDYGYSLSVTANTVISTATAGLTLESNPEYRALHERARVAATALGTAVVRSVCGRNGINGCWEGALKRLIALHERADGRPVQYDKRRGQWVVAS